MTSVLPRAGRVKQNVKRSKRKSMRRRTQFECAAAAKPLVNTTYTRRLVLTAAGCGGNIKSCLGVCVCGE